MVANRLVQVVQGVMVVNGASGRWVALLTATIGAGPREGMPAVLLGVEAEVTMPVVYIILKNILTAN